MRLFISYAKKDTRDLALHLRDLLQAAVPGLFAWMDDTLETGESWALQIQTEIDQCDLVVVLLSPDVNRPITPGQRRSFVLNEIDYAQQENKAIIPVIAQPAKVPVQLAGIEYIDLTRDFESGKQRLVNEVQRRLGTPAHVSVGTRHAVSLQPPDLAHILPPPFEWCAIPAGWVTLEDASDPWHYLGSADPEDPPGTPGGKYHVKRFWMAKYLITNAQYRVFENDEDGYMNPVWWDYAEVAHLWRENHPTPNDPQYRADDLPRTSVCWYEAAAFCRWLTAQTVGAHGRAPLQIILPTEQQWQRAAQGDDGRIYPWGNDEPDKDRCNFNQNIGRPTPVNQYPTGVSPYGVFDMAGNLDEWCSTAWGTDQTVVGDNMVLRGGSWASDASDVRAAFRSRYGTPFRDLCTGFRVVVGIPV